MVVAGEKRSVDVDRVSDGLAETVTRETHFGIFDEEGLSNLGCCVPFWKSVMSREYRQRKPGRDRGRIGWRYLCFDGYLVVTKVETRLMLRVLRMVGQVLTGEGSKRYVWEAGKQSRLSTLAVGEGPEFWYRSGIAIRITLILCCVHTVHADYLSSGESATRRRQLCFRLGCVSVSLSCSFGSILTPPTYQGVGIWKTTPVGLTVDY